MSGRIPALKYGISAKFILAMLVAVTLPLGASVILMVLALDSSFQVGFNQRVYLGLERTPAVYRALFDALKNDFEHSADGYVASQAFRELLASGDEERLLEHLSRLVEDRDDLVELSLIDDGGSEIVVARREPAGDEEAFREWSEERDLLWKGEQGRLVARFVAPRHHFESFQQAGQLLEVYETLEQGRFYLRNHYVALYLALVFVVLSLALGLGLLMSRRVTSRVVGLCEATRRVAGGDLTIRVTEGPLDEIGELASTFNAMVERLLESRERIEYLQRVAAWQQLARRLAHEIKNPLTPIQLAVEELQDRYHGDDECFRRVLTQATEIVIEEVDALRTLTTEFSSFAKLPQVDLRSLELRGFLEELTQPLFLLASDRAKIIVELPSEEISVTMDRMLMKRVLDNLVRNAVDAIDGAHIDGHVVVRGGRDKVGSPFIIVEDDGPGIGDEERERIFEPYYTTKETGTGLGLAIVKKIVLEHGGIVTVEPIEKGTKFMIRLSK